MFQRLTTLAESMVWTCLPIETEYTVDVIRDVTRGLDYYDEGKGFEITVAELGSSKQVVGGGAYERGIGFALGLDRILTLRQ